MKMLMCSRMPQMKILGGGGGVGGVSRLLEAGGLVFAVGGGGGRPLPHKILFF